MLTHDSQLTPALKLERDLRSPVIVRSWVMDLAAIRRRYIRTWFTVDIVAATPYDVLAVLVGDHWIGRLQACSSAHTFPPCRLGGTVPTARSEAWAASRACGLSWF